MKARKVLTITISIIISLIILYGLVDILRGCPSGFCVGQGFLLGGILLPLLVFLVFFLGLINLNVPELKAKQNLLKNYFSVFIIIASFLVIAYGLEETFRDNLIYNKIKECDNKTESYFNGRGMSYEDYFGSAEYNKLEFKCYADSGIKHNNGVVERGKFPSFQLLLPN